MADKILIRLTLENAVKVEDVSAQSGMLFINESEPDSKYTVLSTPEIGVEHTCDNIGEAQSVFKQTIYHQVIDKYNLLTYPLDVVFSDIVYTVSDESQLDAILENAFANNALYVTVRTHKNKN